MILSHLFLDRIGFQSQIWDIDYCHFDFQSLEVLSPDRELKFQVTENYFDLSNLVGMLISQIPQTYYTFKIAKQMLIKHLRN